MHTLRLAETCVLKATLCDLPEQGPTLSPPVHLQNSVEDKFLAPPRRRNSEAVDRTSKTEWKGRYARKGSMELRTDVKQLMERISAS